MDAYIEARRAWRAASHLRARRRRYKGYTYGRQWDDPITTPTGEVMTEWEYARLSGKEPMTNNVIRQMVKSVIGRFRHYLSESGDGAVQSAAVKAAAADNHLKELDCRLLEEFLISGCAIQRVVAERRPGSKSGIRIDNVSPSRFFVNSFTDPRGSDIELVGMLHDMSLQETLMRYGHGDENRLRRIRRIYGHRSAAVAPDAPTAVGEESYDDFDTAPQGRCRVVEVWRREGRDLLKCHDRAAGTLYYLDAADRERLDELNADGHIDVMTLPTLAWHAYYYAPGGELLDDTPSPYAHGSHPFAVKFYPLTDGEVHSFVEDVIDQQRYINRLITLIDHVMSFSAKGVLLFPEEAKPDELTWEQVARQWCRPNGILPYHSGEGEPHQVNSSGAASGAYELLNTELKLFEQISGVSGALQGQAASGKTSASLYDSQIQNAAISLLDTFDTFNAFRSLRDALIEEVASRRDINPY